jgi:thiamine pyrophosphokinase
MPAEGAGVQHAVVIVGGERPDRRVLTYLPPDAFVIAADSGLDHAMALGLPVHLVVGDLDSVSDDAIAAAEASGIPIERHRVDKDATDAELAVIAAIERDMEHIIIVTGAGVVDRFDHLLGTVLLLGHERFERRRREAWVGGAHLDVVTGPGAITATARVGETVTLLPIGGAATGIVTDGLRYPLCSEDLPAATSRGISNVAATVHPTIRIERGTLLVIRPEAIT